VLANAPHPNAGRLFMNWLLSADCAMVLADNFQTPVRDDVPPNAATKPVSQVKLMRVTTEEIDKGVPQAIEDWRDTFGS
jgi:iron(III) transport system substrate-binding protein